jgi:hypothetical protein
MASDEGAAPGGGEAAATCAAHPRQRVLGSCADCGQPLCYQCAVHADGEAAAQVAARAMRCAACTAGTEQPQAANLPLAAILGAVGALVGAGIWAVVAMLANAEVGYIAWGIGALAGFGVVLGARPSRGQPYQVTAVVCALVGLAVGKYFGWALAISQAFEKQEGQPMPFGPASGEMLQLFTSNLSDVLGPFDLLWLALGVATAWRIPASSVTRVAAARAGARARRRPDGGGGEAV